MVLTSVSLTPVLRLAQKSITEYFEELDKLGRKPLQLTNPLAGELGIKNADDLDSFIKNAMPEIKLASETMPRSGHGKHRHELVTQKMEKSHDLVTHHLP